jgi:hypothetical protein
VNSRRCLKLVVVTVPFVVVTAPFVGIPYFFVMYNIFNSVVDSVAELKKLFVSAMAPTFKKFLFWSRLRHKLCGYLFSQLLIEKVDFS